MKLLEFPKDKNIIDAVVSGAELASLMIPSPREAYIKEVCSQAKNYGFAGVLATPFDCPAVVKELEGSGVEVICNNALNHALDENLDCRLYSMDALIDIGVRCFELAVPAGLIRDGKFDVIEEEFKALMEKAGRVCGKVSMIIEPEITPKADQARLAEIAVKLGVDHVRIGSGMEKICGTNGGRATINSVSYISSLLNGRIAIKAGGGWDYAYLEDSAEYMECGASRTDIGPRCVEQLQLMGYRR